MTIDTKEIAVSIKKGMVYSTRISYRYSCNHPFVLGTALFFFLLYRYLPSLFGFLVSSSPIIACTAVLLGVLLSHGKPNIPDINEEEEKEKTSEISSLKATTIANNLIVERDETFPVETHIESKMNIEETSPKDVTHGEWKVIEKSDFLDDEFIGNIDSSMEKLAGDASEEAGDHSKKDANIHDKLSDSDSDGAESSSPDASMADIIPMLDELHPLLDSELPQPVLRESKSDSEGSSHDEVSDNDDDGAVKESVEVSDSEGSSHIEVSDDDDDVAVKESEAAAQIRLHGGDENKVVVKWTADDEKNVMDLGTSELERNRRLENLIAKRRARKELERNLIDLDAGDHLPMFHIPPVSTMRRNPFDLPFDSEVAPGSAPSVLLPRRNPFDLPYDEVSNRGGNVMEGEASFRRHESFSLGASFAGEIMQERRDFSRLGPYFQTERMAFEEEIGYNFQRQFSEMSDSKVSSIPESESVSSTVAEKDYNSEPFVEKIDQNSKHDSIEEKILSSSDEDSDESEKGGSGSNIDEVHEIGRALEMELRTNSDGEHVASPVAPEDGEIFSKMEAVLQEKLSRSSSSSSSEESVKVSSIDEVRLSLEQALGGSSNGSSASVRSVAPDSDLISMDVMHEGQAKEPVYDSSPSAIEKSLSNAATLEGPLFFSGSGSGSFNSTSSASDMQVETLMNFSAETKVTTTAGSPWVVSLNLSPVEENEPSSRDPNTISETDIIHPGFLGASKEECSDSPIFEQIAQEHSSPSSLETKSSLFVSTDNEAVIKFEDKGLGNVLNLPSIPSVVVEDCKHEEEHEIMSSPVLNATVTESELSICHNQYIKETGNDDDMKSFTALNILDPVHDSMESSNFIEKEPGLLKSNSCTSLTDEERTDGVTQEDKEMKAIDEDLLSELDVVGEYHVPELITFDQEVSSEHCLSTDNPETVKADVGGDAELMIADSELHDFNAIPYEDIHVAFRQFHEAGETEKISSKDPTLEGKKSSLEGDSELLNLGTTYLEVSNAGPAGSVPFELVDDKSQLAEFEVSHSELLQGEARLDTMEVHSDLHVIDATSIEDIDSVLKPVSEESINDSTVEGREQKQAEVESAFKQISEENLENSVSSESESEANPSEMSTKEVHSELMVDDKMEEPFVANLVVDDREPILAKDNSDLPVLEANSVEDSETTFEEVSEENHETPTSPKLESQASQLETLARSELEEVPSGLHVVEAKSIEDIQSLLKPVHADEISTVSADLEHGSSEAEPTEVRFETLVYEVHSSQVIDLDTEESIDDPSSSEVTVEKKHKKNKSSKSSSSSSSSSSDSD
ncbi:hypothetical protein QJS04_geneDACA003538 [Acorus gramineus]|uniref:Uncharacterized protein n=1 Tax=Acorus gramineus TaxID=55184 RepID=A0AAV9BRN6_ACOGR|nr:hypothetical protein QJS04_geneDACA003538 [Acorus gramineus]